MFAGGDDFTDMLRGLNESTSTQHTGDSKAHRQNIRDHIFDTMNKLRQDDFLCDVTLLIGPEKIPFRAHRIVLASFSEYFRGMFSAGTKESSEQDVCLPSVDPEPMKIILDYIYSGKADLCNDNVQKVVVAANFFGAELLVNECSHIMKSSMNKRNSLKLLEFSDRYNLENLKKYAKSFVLQNLEELSKSDMDFVRLPISLLIELVEHPAAVVCDENPAENEKQLFMLLWNSIAWLEDEHQKQYIPKILNAVHLPCVTSDYLQYIETKVGHISEAKDLIIKAKEMCESKARKAWATPRGKFRLPMQLKTNLAELERDNEVHSKGVFLQGIMFHICLSLTDHISIVLHSSRVDALRHVRTRFWMRKPVTSVINFDGTEVVTHSRSLVITGIIEPTKTGTAQFASRVMGSLESWRSKLGDADFEIDTNITMDDNYCDEKKSNAN